MSGFTVENNAAWERYLAWFAECRCYVCGAWQRDRAKGEHWPTETLCMKCFETGHKGQNFDDCPW